MLCQLQDQGGVGESSGTQTEIAFVREELKAVTVNIHDVEVEIKECKDPEEKKQLREKEKQLREKEKQLRDKEARLEQKELILLQQSGANSKPVHLLSLHASPPFSILPSHHRIIPLPSLAFIAFA